MVSITGLCTKVHYNKSYAMQSYLVAEKISCCFTMIFLNPFVRQLPDISHKQGKTLRFICLVNFLVLFSYLLYWYISIYQLACKLLFSLFKGKCPAAAGQKGTFIHKFTPRPITINNMKCRVI